jgi:hypothetical protein
MVMKSFSRPLSFHSGHGKFIAPDETLTSEEYHLESRRASSEMVAAHIFVAWLTTTSSGVVPGPC